MDMLHRDCQCDELIQEPCDVQCPVIFRYDQYLIALFCVFAAELDYQTVVRFYGLLHIVKATIARNHHHAFGMEVQFGRHRRAFQGQMHLHFSFLDLIPVNIHKELILQQVVKFVYSWSEILQIYFI